jgi:hypothetical protein
MAPSKEGIGEGRFRPANEHPARLICRYCDLFEDVGTEAAGLGVVHMCLPVGEQAFNDVACS